MRDRKGTAGNTHKGQEAVDLLVPLLHHFVTVLLHRLSDSLSSLLAFFMSMRDRMQIFVLPLLKNAWREYALRNIECADLLLDRTWAQTLSPHGVALVPDPTYSC